MHLNFKKQKIFHFYVNESFQLPLLIPIKEKSFKIVSQPFFLNEGSYMVCFEVDGEEQSMNDKIKSFVVLLLYCKCNPIQQSNDKWTMVDGLFFFCFIRTVWQMNDRWYIHGRGLWLQSINDHNRIRNHIHRSLRNRRRRDVCSSRRILRNLRNRRIHRSSRVPQVHHRQRFPRFRLSRFSLGPSTRPSSHTAKEPGTDMAKELLDIRTLHHR